MKKILLITGICCLSVSTLLGFFDFHMGPRFPDEPAYYVPADEDGAWKENPDQNPQNYERRKVYLPPEDRIYRDEHGKYFYVGKYKRDPGASGSGGLTIKLFNINSTQKAALTAQLSADSISATPKDSMLHWGGGGYFHAGPNFYFGGSGAGGIMTAGSGSSRLKFSMGYGGIDFLILIPIGVKHINLIGGSLIGAGGLEMQSTSTNKYEKTFFVIGPKAGIQYNFTKFFAMRLMAEYLYSQDIDAKIEGTLAPGVDFDRDLSLRNYLYSITFEWGGF